jgi:hypothetical protein
MRASIPAMALVTVAIMIIFTPTFLSMAAGPAFEQANSADATLLLGP